MKINEIGASLSAGANFYFGTNREPCERQQYPWHETILPVRAAMGIRRKRQRNRLLLDALPWMHNEYFWLFCRAELFLFGFPASPPDTIEL